MVLTTVIGVHTIVKARALEREIAQSQIPRLNEAMMVTQRLNAVASTAYHLLTNEDPDQAPALKTEHQQTRALLERALKKIVGEAGEEIKALNAAFTDELDRALERRSEAHDHERLREVELSLHSASTRLVGERRSHTARLIEASSATLLTGLALFVALNVLGFAALVTGGWMFVRRVVVRRMEAVASATRRMSAGNLETVVEAEGNDEVTDVAHALDIFREHALEIQRLNLVEQLSEELKTNNAELQRVLAELRSAQEQVILQEKLAALGQLAAGVAHEIKNPLNFILNFAIATQHRAREVRELVPAPQNPPSDAEEELADTLDDIDDNLARVVDHSTRADNIVKAMLQHSRSTSGPATAVDINALIQEFVNLAYHSQRALDHEFNLTIETDLDDGAKTITAVAQDLGRVLLNLLTNACQATATRRAGEGKGYMPTLHVATARNAEHVEIRVRDNGTGIPDEVRQKIFEPFFTTKHADAGTGLGLSISNDIVRAHGGELTVESELGEFTEFRVVLPVSGAASTGG